MTVTMTTNVPRDDWKTLGRRWLKFNFVGALGIGVQLAALATLTTLGLRYLAATALAVETAVVHNFLWHERMTWRDRATPLLRQDRKSTRLNSSHIQKSRMPSSA